MTLPRLLGFACLTVFVLALVGRAFSARRRAKLAHARSLVSAYGQAVDRDRDMHAIASLYRLRPTGVGDESATYDVSERTWRDLSLDAVFARLDRCVTPLGQQRFVLLPS